MVGGRIRIPIDFQGLVCQIISLGSYRFTIFFCSAVHLRRPIYKDCVILGSTDFLLPAESGQLKSQGRDRRRGGKRSPGTHFQGSVPVRPQFGNGCVPLPKATAPSYPAVLSEATSFPAFCLTTSFTHSTFCLRGCNGCLLLLDSKCFSIS